MKKLLLIIVLLLLLSGCTFLKNPILRTIGNEIDTCEDECQTDENLYASYLEAHKERIDELIKSFINNDGVEMMILRNDEFVKKEDIVRHDYITDNFDIPVLYPINNVSQYIYELDIISKNCDSAGVCNETIDMVFRKNSDFKYGFDEYTGYYTYLINNNDIEYTKAVRFNINDQEIEYISYIINNTDMSIVDFDIFQKGIFKSYHYVSDTEYDFFYINQNTTDSLFLKQESENEVNITAYVSDTQRFYIKTAANNFQ
ncbi:MAG: lipoprotein, partial [Candidatus Izemoplasmatales bacterium]|nr:lipoprotein [Candidatus Izemoplasmatales bacterium]